VHPVLFHIGAVLIPSYGAVTALGVLLALGLALRTARVAGRDTDLDASKVWNLCILSLFTALAAARLLLIIVNWSALRLHPAWLLGLAMVHHPLLAGTGALAGAGCALWYARHSKLPLGATADALAPPLALGLCFEQLGALASGSGYGVEAGPGVHWAVTYTNPLAAIWSGAPLGVPLHPVQAYAGRAPQRRRGRPGFDGRRRRHLHHRTLARSRRPWRAAQWSARRAADCRCAAGDCRGAGAARTSESVRSERVGFPPFSR
jgi:phosphatidylglycerol:prolipoprotein diacylglycerol transferase